MGQTKINNVDIIKPMVGENVTLGSGISILNSNSGINNLGSVALPFSSLYANNVFVSGGSIGNGTFVHLTGDRMSGALTLGSGGVHLLSAGSGTSNIGSPSNPFNSIFATNIIISGQTLDDKYVNVTGDSINGTITLGSGVNILNSVSGINEIGSISNPLRRIYALNFVDPSSSGNDFVFRAGDSMTGDLNIQTRLNVGSSNILAGLNAITIGSGNVASGNFSTAEGDRSKARGNGSHAGGFQSEAIGDFSRAEGYMAIASGDYSHAQNFQTLARGLNSHAEGNATTAYGTSSHAEGYLAIASGSQSHAEGLSTVASGNNSHAEGSFSVAIGDNSHAEGFSAIAAGNGSHAEGGSTESRGQYSHAEGSDTLATGAYSHAEGLDTSALGEASHAEGWSIANGAYSHTEGGWLTRTQTFGKASHAEGDGTLAIGDYSHSEGQNTVASGTASHAEGSNTVAVGGSSHAEGQSTYSLATSSHAEGENTYIEPGAAAAHAEGQSSYIGPAGLYGHAEGTSTEVYGNSAHAQGYQSIASGNTSFAAGTRAKAMHDYSIVFSDITTLSTSSNQFTLQFLSGVSLTSGTNILNVVSGINNLGSAAKPFSGVYSKTGYFTNISGLSPINILSDVNFNASKISGTSSFDIIVPDSGYLYLTSANTNTAIGIEGGEGISIKGNTDVTIFTNNSNSAIYIGATEIGTDMSLIPNTSGTKTIGKSSHPFSGAYAKSGYFTDLSGLYATAINLQSHLIPSVSGVTNLGSSDKRFSNIYASTGNFTVVTGMSPIGFASDIHAIPSGSINIGSASNPFSGVFAGSAILGTVITTGSYTAKLTDTNIITSQVAPIQINLPPSQAGKQYNIISTVIALTNTVTISGLGVNIGGGLIKTINSVNVGGSTILISDGSAYWSLSSLI